ncbi:MAG: SDR family oxidoreductase [Gammaproteobacteria bacterium]|nr:SDR family oxidoreductase [Gammaproteobacteria bacterium]
MNLNGKTVLLTGASGGIGSAISKRLVKEGCRLLLIDRHEKPLQLIQRELDGSRHTHKIIVADINSSDSRADIVEQAQHAKVDILINAAGILDFQLLEKQNSNIIEQTITTNLISPILLCKDLIPQLTLRPQATIVNLGSIFGSIGHPGFDVYCASKSGLKTFTEALRRELADTSVKVKYLAPRATSTKLNSNTVTELNKALGNKTDTPEHVASSLVTLLTRDKNELFMGWPEKLLVRVNALFPGIVHNALVKQLAVIKKFAQQ